MSCRRCQRVQQFGCDVLRQRLRARVQIGTRVLLTEFDGDRWVVPPGFDLSVPADMLDE